MLDLHRPAADARPMARRLRVSPKVRFRRAGIIAGIAMLAVVAGIGAATTFAASGAHPAAAGSAVTAATTVGSAWDTGSGSDINPIDIVAKAGVVVILLFITLRVLGRMQSGSTKREGRRMTVLESRVLAPKASLHLVAVGGRRLVIGLTPSGMVSLAELDASELKETEAELALAGAADPTTAQPFAAASLKVPSFATAAGAAILAPIDALAGRIAGLLSGGRAR
jgi:flagellar biogenesis protein FliO